MQSHSLYEESFFETRVKDHLVSIDRKILVTLSRRLDSFEHKYITFVFIDEFVTNINLFCIWSWYQLDWYQWIIVNIEDVANRLRIVTFFDDQRLILWYMKDQIAWIECRKRNCNTSKFDWWHDDESRREREFSTISRIWEYFATLLRWSLREQSHNIFFCTWHINRIFRKRWTWLSKWIVSRASIVNYQESKDTKDKSRQQCHQASRYKLTN